MKYLSSLISVFIVLLLSQGAIAADIAGRIIMARGDVQAISENGVMRKLKRRDSIFNHEVIKTGPASKVQIRFIDNALLALKENSELNIKAYVYNEVNQKDNQVLMELVAGGFRTLTGKIGKGNKEAYKVVTPVASIGIRGTHYDIQILMDKIYAGVWKGGIALKTEQGSFDLGMNANFDFAEISPAGDFTGLLTPPEALTPISEAAEKENSQENSDEPTNENQSTEEESTPTPSLPEENNNNAPSPFEAESAPDQQILQDSEIITQESISEEQLVPDEIPLPVEGYTPDIRLTPAEFTQLANFPKIAFLIGSGTQGNSVSLNTDGTGDIFFLSPIVQADGTSGNETLRRGGANEKDMTNSQPWSDQVNWGVWEGTTATPIERYTRFNNDQYFEPLASDLFYMEFTPASTLEINNGLVDGNFTYSTSTMSLAGTGQTDFIASASNGGQVTNVAAKFDLNVNAQSYTLSNIYLDINVDLNNDMSADQVWNMLASTGKMDSSNITIDNLQGYLTTNSTSQQDQATGTLTGFLLTPKAGSTLIDTFAGGFELSTINGVEHVGGVLILQTGQVIPQ